MSSQTLFFKKPYLDRQKFTNLTLFVIIGFIALLLGKISGVEWAGIVAIYVAGQSYVDRAKELVVDPDRPEYPKEKE